MNLCEMKKIVHVSLILALILWLPFAAIAEEPAKNSSLPQPEGTSKQICQTISLVTGVAISPLMGVGVVGAVKWWTTPKEKRASLPWFANPLFWVPALLLVAACFVKDSSGIVLPPGLKKPFDAAETIEHKISGIVATGAFVPIAASIFQAPDHQTGASLASMGLATIDLHWLYNALMVPVAMAAFFIVFLASNAIQILILISPFGVLDAALKAFRTSIIASIAVTSFANPWVGAAWALIIILLSYFIAGWSFRLSHFGLVFVWDFFTGRRSRFTPDPKVNKMFLSRKTQKVPARTYGKLSRNDKGELIFDYHPWLVLPQCTLILPAGDYATGRGVFYSEIMRVEGDSARTVMLLPPRYLGHEGELAKVYNFTGARDVGIRAAWAWFKSLFGGATKTAPA